MKLEDSSYYSSTENRTMVLTLPASEHSGNRSVIASKTIDNSEGWIEILIQGENHHNMVMDHRQYIEVTVTEPNGTPTLSAISTQHQPTLVFDVQGNSRVSRSTNHRICQANTRQCCMQQFTLNFHEIGWDFVIEPTEYIANYCRGSCTDAGPFIYDHSQVISLSANRLRARNRGRSTGLAAALEEDLTPCCAPERLEPLDIVYLDDNNVITVDILSDMTVTSCGCS